MGHTLDQWRTKVAALLRDQAGVDLAPDQLDDAGIWSAFNEHSRRDPREIVVEVAGNGTSFYDVPAGWIRNVSRLVEVEYPARQNPRRLLIEADYPIPAHTTRRWRMTRSDTDVDVEQVALLGLTPSPQEYLRFTFTGMWPLPTGDASVDQIDDMSFEGVASLAASLCCESLASQAARGRDGVLSSDLVAGDNRAANLTRSALALRDRYERFAFAVWGAV